MAQDNIVTFLMPDGTEVSNDPRFDMEKQREKMLASTPNRGDVGITDAEFRAQTLVNAEGAPNSTQPGVGPNATLDDPVAAQYGPLGSPAMQRQASAPLSLDADKAKELGASPDSTATEDPEPVDSNEVVLELRREKAEAQAKALKALEALGEGGEGSPDEPYSEWTAAQLKAEALKRNATRGEGEGLDLSGIRKKSELAELLEQDDAANPKRDSTDGDGPTGNQGHDPDGDPMSSGAEDESNSDN